MGDKPVLHFEVGEAERGDIVTSEWQVDPANDEVWWCAASDGDYYDQDGVRDEWEPFEYLRRGWHSYDCWCDEGDEPCEFAEAVFRSPEWPTHFEVVINGVRWE